MANPSVFSTNIAIGILPEYDSKKDPALYNELARLRAGIRNLAAALDQYTGASAINQAQFSNGYIPFGSTLGLTANATLAYNNTTHTVTTTNITLTGSLAVSTLQATPNALGFFSKASAPIVQPTTAFGAAVFVANAGAAINDASTFDGYTLKQIASALRALGILA